MLDNLKYDYQLVDTEEKRTELLQNLLTKEIFSLDTETTGTDPITAELVGMSFSYAENQAFYVPVPADRAEAQKIVNEFRPAFEKEGVLKVGQNIKYDMLVLGNYGTEVRRSPVRYHGGTLCTTTGIASQHGLPCRNLPALSDYPHRRTDWS